MKLVRYQVTNFRSVKDSGWIEVDGVSALIGVNESGKTNLLLPLWKLNPAREGAIQPTSDYPKSIFGEVRAKPGDFTFIRAEFATGDLATTLAQMTNVPSEQLDIVCVSKRFDGAMCVSFPNYKAVTSIARADVQGELDSAITDLGQLEALKPEEAFKTTLLALLPTLAPAGGGDEWRESDFVGAIAAIRERLPGTPAKTSTLVPRTTRTIDALETWLAEIRSPKPTSNQEAVDFVCKAVPKFVYYSNYGNLDSEIYLPHVVQNMARTDLGAKESAKVRTLKVLFNFVRLQPNEIQQLGQDFKDTGNPTRKPTDAEIEAIAERKRERSILLQSAGTSLTKKFKDWWKQGDYRFRFEADGDHFRIWVADDRRPEEIELESRSTGLQWFLSFYLIFLVESEGEHDDAILLLDEPGLSLHPLAQRDLSAFFENLSHSNQILYTTHSPFLVDADRLDRVRKVYVAEDGSTKASANLREAGADRLQPGAAYAVHSALNLNVAESLLVGCLPVVVEGQSDQHYLTMIKSLLIGAGKIRPHRELVFPPAGGTKTLRLTAAILTGRDEALPFALLDGDVMGAKMATELKTSLYQDDPSKLLSTDQFAGFKGSELEDLIPLERFAEAVDRIFRAAEHQFSEEAKAGQPIVPQVESWAAREGVALFQGWKVDVAKRVKQTLLAKGIASVDDEFVQKWVDLFKNFSPDSPENQV